MLLWDESFKDSDVAFFELWSFYRFYFAHSKIRVIFMCFVVHF